MLEISSVYISHYGKWRARISSNDFANGGISQGWVTNDEKNEERNKGPRKEKENSGEWVKEITPCNHPFFLRRLAPSSVFSFQFELVFPLVVCVYVCVAIKRSWDNALPKETLLPTQKMRILLVLEKNSVDCHQTRETIDNVWKILRW